MGDSALHESEFAGRYGTAMGSDQKALFFQIRQIPANGHLRYGKSFGKVSDVNPLVLTEKFNYGCLTNIQLVAPREIVFKSHIQFNFFLSICQVFDNLGYSNPLFA